MEFLQLLLENSDSILASIGGLLGGVVSLATVVQKFMPDKISHKGLATLEAVSSTLSLGTKKSTIIKK